MSVVKHPLSVIAVFLWIGFVCAISFMEAWLKFKAEGITLPLGLGIGRLVFHALNKVEWVFALSIVFDHFKAFKIDFTIKFIWILIPIGILVLQTFWLLPDLDKRAINIIHGVQVDPSNFHLLFVVVEVIKVLCLGVFGISLFNLKRSK